LRKEFSELLKLLSLWTRSYFAITAGNISQEMIQKYIDAQKGRRSHERENVCVGNSADAATASA